MDKDNLERWERAIDRAAHKLNLPVETVRFITLDAPCLRVDALALRKSVVDVKLTFMECWRRKNLSQLEADYSDLVSRWINLVEKEVPPECFFPYPPGPRFDYTALERSVEKLGMVEGKDTAMKGLGDIAERLTAIIADLSNALYQKQNAASFRVSCSVTAVAAVAAVVAAFAALISLSSC